MRLDGQPPIEPPRRSPSVLPISRAAVSVSGAIAFALAIRHPRGLPASEKDAVAQEIDRQPRAFEFQKLVPDERFRTRLNGLSRRAEPCHQDPALRQLSNLSRLPTGRIRFARASDWSCAPATFCRSNPCRACDREFLSGELPLRKLSVTPAAPRPFPIPSFYRPRYCTLQKNPCVRLRMPKAALRLNRRIEDGCGETVRNRSKL